VTSLFPRPATDVRASRPSVTLTVGEALTFPGPIQADRVHQRPPEEPAARVADERLRCLWYTAGLVDVFSFVEEFLGTAAGTAALADFCRARRGAPGLEFEACTLIETIASTAARLRA
jgi:hypothetical protein